MVIALSDSPSNCFGNHVSFSNRCVPNDPQPQSPKLSSRESQLLDHNLRDIISILEEQIKLDAYNFEGEDEDFIIFWNLLNRN